MYEKGEELIWETMAKLTPLLGIWRGSGHAKFPTITTCDYTEETTFQSNNSEPLIHFVQKTWVQSTNTNDGAPLHWESGFIRPLADGSIEMSNAQNNGRVEVLKGKMDEAVSLQGQILLILDSVLFGNDPRLMQTRRCYKQHGNMLKYTIEMATAATPQLQQHLEASLFKNSMPLA